jgi:hypothetical protein
MTSLPIRCEKPLNDHTDTHYVFTVYRIPDYIHAVVLSHQLQYNSIARPRAQDWGIAEVVRIR